MQLVVETTGGIRAIYAESIDLAALGRPAVRRAGRVEPDGSGRWLADLGPVLGPVLGPFAHRSEALAAEFAWLEANWLVPPGRARESPPFRPDPTAGSQGPRGE